MKYDWDIKPD